MQAGLWQSSCPSARLIMQERHSRPPFILPGGEAVPACSPYHMALAPLSSLTLSLSLLGLLWMGLVLEERGSYWWCGGTPQHAVQLSFFPPHCSFFPLSFLSSLHFPLCERETSEAEKKKREKRERNRRPSLLQGDNNSFFFISHRRALTTAVAALGG